MLSDTISQPDHSVSGKLLVTAWLLGEILFAGRDLFDSRICILIARKWNGHLCRGRSESSNAGDCVGPVN